MAATPHGSPGSVQREADGSGDEEDGAAETVAPNLGATASGARTRVDEAGVLPFHKAVYGPWPRGIGAEAREKADPRIIDVSLALNCWMPPAAAPAEADERDRPTAQEARAARRDAAEAERLAAAADAHAFFEEQALKRRAEHTMDGLALEKAVRDARCKPWDVWTRRNLTDAGIDATAAERAVREWEPQLFEDPIDSRHVAGSWEAERESRARGLQTLVKEGWLWMPGIGRKWVMLRKDKGLLWSQAPRDYILGMVLFKFLASFSKSRDDDCAIEFTRDRHGVRGAKVCLQAATPEEAGDWLALIAAEFENFQINNGIGFLEEVRVLQPSRQVDIKLPAVDLNEEIRERAVIFHVKESQEFDEGDLLCEIERAGNIQPNVEVFARFPGRVLQIQKSRKETGKDSMYSYFAVDDVILRLLRDPDWVEGERYLPRVAPTDAQRECVARRVGGMELVESDSAEGSRPSSRATSQMPTRLLTRQGTSTSRKSTGRHVHIQDIAPRLVSAVYVDHPDDFWTRHALILSGIQVQDAPGSVSHQPASHADLPLSTAGGSRRPETRSRVLPPRSASQQAATAASCASRAHRLAGTAAEDFSHQTLHSRYSSSAIAAASKILLQSTSV